MAQHSTLGELNRKYFDAQAPTAIKQQWTQDLATQIINHLRSNLAWVGVQRAAEDENPTLRMLDYACGWGVASTAMSPFVSQSRGIDVSSAMVELYNKAAEANGLTSDQMRAVQGDLLATRNHPGESSLDSPEFFNFDLIIMSMALHHVHGPEEMVAKLVDRLKEGGMVIFIDWVPEAEGANAKGHPSGQDHESHTERGHHASEHINAHDGFSAEQMRTMLARAGCYDVDFVLADEPSKLPEEFGGQKQLFFARGRK